MDLHIAATSASVCPPDRHGVYCIHLLLLLLFLSIVEANACVTAPCKQVTNRPAICSDLPAPAPNNASGRVCSCSSPSFLYTSDALGCSGKHTTDN